MPNQASNLARLRRDGFSLRCYASAYIPLVAASGTVFAIGTAFPNLDIGVTYLVGAYTDVHYGFEVVFRTPGGVFKCRTHVRAGGVINVGGNLPLREHSFATLNVEIGDLFTIYREVRIHDKLVAPTSTFDPDYLLYTDEGSNPSPVVDSGVIDVGWVDSGQTYRTSAIIDGSYPVDPDSGGSMTYLITRPSGVALAPTYSDTDASPTLRVNVGSYLIQRDVTDADNSKTQTQWVARIVHDATHLPYDCLITALEGSDRGANDPQADWSATIQLFGSATLADLPDGSLIVLWTDEVIGGTAGSIRSDQTGRSHILFVGYARKDTAKWDGDHETLTLELQSPLARLNEITAYSKVMISNQTPDSWSLIKTLMTNRGMTTIVKVYTTLNEAGYVWQFDADLYNAVYPRLYLKKTSPIEQLVELVKGVGGRMACLRDGRFEMQPRLALLALADRAAVTNVLTPTADDVDEHETSREHVALVETYQLNATTEGASDAAVQAVFSRYPGNAPGEARGNITQDKAIVVDQLDANARAGMLGAEADSTYVNDDGERQSVGEQTLRFGGAYDVFDFRKEFAVFNYSGALRGVDYNGLRLILKRARLNYDADMNNAKLETTWQQETAAPDAETYVPPTSNLPVVTVPRPPPVRRTPRRVPAWTGELPTTLLSCAYSTAQFSITRLSWTAGTAVHTELSTGLTTAGIFFCADPYNAKSLYMICQDGLYNCSDYTTGAAWTLLKTNAQLFGNSTARGHWIGMSINRQGLIIVASGLNALAVSYDFMATTTLVAADGGAATYGTDPESLFNVSVALYPYSSAGDSIIHAFVDPGDGFHRSLCQSTDWAASFTNIYPNWTSGASHGGEWKFPYRKVGGAANTGNIESRASTRGGAPPFNGQILLSDQDSAWALATVLYAAVSPLFNIPRADGCGIIPFTWDANYVFVAAQTGAAVGGVLYTPDNFVTPTFTALSPATDAACGVNTFPTNERVFVFFGYAGSGGLLPGELDGTGAAVTFDVTPPFYSDAYVHHAEFSLVGFI